MFHSDYGAYLVLSARYSELLVGDRKIFIPYLYLVPPQRVTQEPHQNFAKMFDIHKTRMIGLAGGKEIVTKCQAISI